MKRVLVSVKSVQRDMDGKDTVVELISPCFNAQEDARELHEQKWLVHR